MFLSATIPVSFRDERFANHKILTDYCKYKGKGAGNNEKDRL